MRVLTVDDQAVFRGIAREVIDATPGFESVGEAASGEEALAAVDRLEPELVLLDVRMPGLDGIEVARRLRATHPDTLLVLISIEEPIDLPSAAQIAETRPARAQAGLRPAAVEADLARAPAVSRRARGVARTLSSGIGSGRGPPCPPARWLPLPTSASCASPWLHGHRTSRGVHGRGRDVRDHRRPDRVGLLVGVRVAGGGRADADRRGADRRRPLRAAPAAVRALRRAARSSRASCGSSRRWPTPSDATLYSIGRVVAAGWSSRC